MFATSTSDGFNYIVSNSGVTIISYKGDLSDIIIPSSIDGKNVVKISDSAFKNNITLHNVEISNGIETIGTGAFSGCTALNSVTIPSSIKNMGVYVFDGCSGLTIHCTSSSVANDYALKYGINFNLIDTDNGCPFEYSVEDGFIRITKYIGNGGNVDIPNEINGIQVRFIGDYAFSNMHGITSVYIPSNVRTLGTGVFMHCYDLNNISVSESNYFYSSLDGVLFNLDKTHLIQYPQAKSGFTYNIPNSVSVIEYAAFRDCLFTNISIPSNVKEIGYYAFADSLSLKSFNITDETLNIGRNVLLNTPWYDNQPDGIVYIGHVAYSIKGDITDIDLRNDTLALAAYIFSGSTNSSFNIPSTVKFIAYGAFQYCDFITEISLPADLDYLDCRAFGNCSSLKNIIFNNSSCQIQVGAFEGCNYPVFICEHGSTAENYGLKYGNPILGQLRVPIISITNITSDSVTISWDAIEGASGYKTYLNDKCITTYPYSQCYDVITGLTPGKTYSVQVSAVNDLSESQCSIAAVFTLDKHNEYDTGDVNCDGDITVADVMIIFQYVSGRRSLTDVQLNLSDMNSDGNVNIADVLLLFKKISYR